MKSRIKTSGLLLFLVVMSLAITGSGVLADESGTVYSGTPALVLNAALLAPAPGQPSAPLSLLSQNMPTTGVSIGNENNKGLAGNFSSLRTFIPAKSSLVTGVKNSQLFSSLEKSYQAHPPGQYYFDSSPLYCSGGY
jgi:hypothetical protein